MDAVTYPTPDVANRLNNDFVPVHLNTAEPTDAVKQAMRDHRMMWTPLFLWFDHHGFELRRQVGYLEPDHFLAELQFAKGMAALRHGQHEAAGRLFHEIADQHGNTPTAPEALYWAGVAGVFGGSKDKLTAAWQELRKRHPDNTWWSRASFIAD